MSRSYPSGPRPTIEERLKEMYQDRTFLLLQLEKLEQDIKALLEKMG